MLRIIGGIYKGRRLRFPKDRNIRLTSDKVRESLYNILRDRIKEANFLELFAGSGGIGIEALSRGAKKVVFIEKNRNAVRIIQENLKIINSESKAEIINFNIIEGLKILLNKKEKFDLIFLDPPYKNVKLLLDTLKFISTIDIFQKNCIIIIEHYKKISLPEKVEIFERYRNLKYGDSMLSFYKIIKEEFFK